MPFRHVLDPDHRTILFRVFDDVCVATGIEPQSLEGQEVANMVLHFYGCGYQTPDGLRAMLDAQIEEIEEASLSGMKQQMARLK